MLKYIVKRLALAILILLGVSLIIYVLIRCMPVSFIEGKIAEMNQGGATIPEEDAEKLTTVGKVVDYLKSKGYGDDAAAPAQ